MYTATRFYYPHGIEGESMNTTEKEYSTVEKAIAYAQRYSKGRRFAGVEVEDEEGNEIYEITSDSEVIDHRKSEKEIKILNNMATQALKNGNMVKAKSCNAVIHIIRAGNEGRAEWIKNCNNIITGIRGNYINAEIIGLAINFSEDVKEKHTFDLHEFEISDLSNLIFDIERMKEE